MAVDTSNRQSVLANITSADATARQKYADAQAKMQAGLKALLGGDPSASTAKIRDYGGKVAGVGDEMRPIASDMLALGGEIGNIGKEINTTGAGLTGLGNDILGMNRDSASPLVQALLGLYDAYSPGRLASLAGQDVANRFGVAKGQQDRQLARQGVNPTSGRYVSLNQVANDAMATAKAAAMTRASMMGLDKQAAFLTDGIAGLGKSLLGQGVSTQAQGAATMGNAVGANQSAAGVLSSVASIFGSAAGLEQAAANMDLGFAKDVMGQNNAMAQLDVATANYYGNLFSELLNYDSQQMRGGGGGGVSTNLSPDQIWERVTGQSAFFNRADLNRGKITQDDFNNMMSQVASVVREQERNR